MHLLFLALLVALTGWLGRPGWLVDRGRADGRTDRARSARRFEEQPLPVRREAAATNAWTAACVEHFRSAGSRLVSAGVLSSTDGRIDVRPSPSTDRDELGGSEDEGVTFRRLERDGNVLQAGIRVGEGTPGPRSVWRDATVPSADADAFLFVFADRGLSAFVAGSHPDALVRTRFLHAFAVAVRDCSNDAASLLPTDEDDGDPGVRPGAR